MMRRGYMVWTWVFSIYVTITGQVHERWMNLIIQLGIQLQTTELAKGSPNALVQRSGCL